MGNRNIGMNDTQGICHYSNEQGLFFSQVKIKRKRFVFSGKLSHLTGTNATKI
jgi:hypothetical protein